MKSTKAIIDAFLAEKTLALAGFSRSGKKFGNTIYKELTQKGYTLYPVHPEAASFDSQVTCWESFDHLPGPVGGLITVVPPTQTEELVRQAAEAGIRRVWMQQGSGSDDAIRFCREREIDVVSGECILMYAEPVVSVHKFHRWIRRLFRRMPE